MAPDLNELLKKLSTAKAFTTLLILLFLAIFAWRNFDFLTEVSFTLKRPDQAAQAEPKEKRDKKSGVPGLALGEILIPPAPRKLPAFVVFEVKNPGSAPVTRVRASLDYGASRVIAYEVIGPRVDEVSGSEPGSSVVNLDIVQLGPGESAYIYAQTSSPGFDSIALSSDDTISVIEYDYARYLAAKNSYSSPTFISFLLVLLSGFLLVMTIYLTMALIQILNKWLRLKWG